MVLFLEQHVTNKNYDLLRWWALPTFLGFPPLILCRVHREREFSESILILAVFQNHY